MIRFIAVIAIGTLTACATGGAETQAAGEREIALVPSNLVHAVVENVVEQDGRVVARLRVTRVYAGDSQLEAKTFVVKGNVSGQSSVGLPSMVPSYKLKEKQIWLVRRDKDRIIPDISGSHLRLAGGIALPAREGVEEPAASAWTTISDWAETVEGVGNLPEQQRLPRLRELAARADNQLTRRWAKELVEKAIEGNEGGGNGSELGTSAHR